MVYVIPTIHKCLKCGYENELQPHKKHFCEKCYVKWISKYIPYMENTKKEKPDSKRITQLLETIKLGIGENK